MPDGAPVPAADGGVDATLAGRIAITHDYIKHQFQLLVGWFTFFVTVNYASMGWLATSRDHDLQKRLALGLCLLFITQNLLGLAITSLVLGSIRGGTERLRQYEALRGPVAFGDLRFDHGVPLEVYRWTVRLMNLAMLLILLTWGYFLGAYGIVSLNWIWSPGAPPR